MSWFSQSLYVFLVGSDESLVSPEFEPIEAATPAVEMARGAPSPADAMDHVDGGGGQVVADVAVVKEEPALEVVVATTSRTGGFLIH